MARSVWKGPFVDGYLLKKAEAARASGRNEVIKIWSRRSTILPQFVGLTFGVYNGQKHIPVIGHRGHGRPQVRRVRADPDLPRPRRRQEGARGRLSDGQDQASAHAQRSPTTRRKAVARMLRVSPQKLNLVAQLIRGKKVATALADLQFSQQAHRRGRQEVPGVGDRQRREQPRPRRRRSRRRRGACRQGAGDEALPRRAAAAASADLEAVLAT